jgi:predicted phosphodiesterase
MRIGLLSDTHSFLDERIFEHFAECDEIWHAGDFGNEVVLDKLKAFKPLRGSMAILTARKSGLKCHSTFVLNVKACPFL